MKLSISNIGFDQKDKDEVYKKMKELSYCGLEIAPTIICGENPYDKLEKARVFKNEILEKYSFVIPSMQSIWYGKTQSIFGNKEDRELLLEYTKKAILFAKEIGCKNLVFGCPKNRVINSKEDVETAINFFKKIGDFAFENNTVVGLEANPKIYNTNFMNTTKEAVDIINKVNSKGIKLNLDFGTIIENNEDLSIVADNIHLINHVHISEPYLKPIKKREEHKQLAKILKENNYDKFVSIEMGKVEDIDVLFDVLSYVKEIF